MKTVEKILLGFDPERKNLLLVLKEISAVFGSIEKEHVDKIAQYFSCSPAQVFETGSFYDDIYFEKKPEILIEVCSCPDCVLKGSLEVVQEIENFFKIKAGEKSGSRIQLKTMSCLGRCFEAPIVRINGEVYSQVEKNKLYEILKKYI